MIMVDLQFVLTYLPVVVVVVMFTGLVIAGIAYYFSKRERIKRTLRAIPGKKIGEFVNGEYAKISGQVYANGETILAPFSGRKCVYYYAIVEENAGKNDWRKVVDEEMMADVIITDGKHYAVVETDEPLTYLIPDREYSSQIFSDATPELEAFLKRHGQSPEGIFGMNRTLRYQEGILEPGEFCTVSGYGEWKTNSDESVKVPANRVLVLKAGIEATVYISDDPETIIN